MIAELTNGIVPLVDWAATIVLFPPDTASVLAVFHLTGLLLDLAAVAPGLYHCYTLLIVRKRRLYTTTSRRAGWRPLPRETLALCLTLFVACDFCWHAALLVGMGFPNTAHAFHNFRYCLVYAGLVQYLVGVMYSIPTASRRALIQALGGAGDTSSKDMLAANTNQVVHNVLDSSTSGAVISPVMSKRSWTRRWALAVLAVPVPSPYLLNGFLITSILFPMLMTLTLSFLVANAWTNETTLALQACLWATWAALALAFGMAVFVFGNQLVLLVSQTIHSQTMRDRSRSVLKKTASSLNHSGGNLHMRPTSTSSVTLEHSHARNQARRTGMPARSASLSVTTDGHVAPAVTARAVRTAAMTELLLPAPKPLVPSPSPQEAPAMVESAEGEHEADGLAAAQSPVSSTLSDMAPTVPRMESTRVLGAAIDAHLDELADEPGEGIPTKSVAVASQSARKGKPGSAGISSSSSSLSGSGGASLGSEADTGQQSNGALSDSGFGASATAGKLGKSKVLYTGPIPSTGGAGRVTAKGSESQPPSQRTSPVGSANQLARSESKLRGDVGSQTGNGSSAGSNTSVNGKPLVRSGQSGLLRGVTFAALLAVQARGNPGAAVADLNGSASSSLSESLFKRRQSQAKQLYKAKARMQMSVACILVVSLVFAGISCFQVVGLLDLVKVAEWGEWVFWVPCVVHIVGGGAMAVPVLWALAWESIHGSGAAATKGPGEGMVASPVL